MKNSNDTIGLLLVITLTNIHQDIPLCIQEGTTLHRLYLETAVHVLGGTITHHQERIQLYLQYLLRQMTESGVTNTRCCRYSCMRS
jgi:hypothetical protein